MGIRIKKVLGYGLVDVALNEDGEITDYRFTQEWKDDPWGDEHEKTIEGYMKFSKRKQEESEEKVLPRDIHLFPQTNFIGGKEPRLDDFLTLDTEYGLPNVVVFTPITGTQWKRYDDQIDYYEEKANGHYSVEPHVSVLDVPLYPYDNYINNETGEWAENNIREWIYMIRNIRMDMKHRPNSEKIDTQSELLKIALKELGCEANWQEKWNVAIPEQIIDYCDYMNVFTDRSTIFKLQPMIYVYWS